MRLQSARPGPDLPEMDAEARILATVDAIPRGDLRGYGEVAAEAGLPGRARLVGRVLSNLDPDSQIPWHRVVRADRRVADGPQRERQLALLAREGVRPKGPGAKGPLIAAFFSE